MIGKALFPDARYSLAFVLNLLAGRPFQQSESRLQHFLGPFNRFELSEPFFLSRHAAKVRSEMLFPQYQIPSSVFPSFPTNLDPSDRPPPVRTREGESQSNKLRFLQKAKPMKIASSVFPSILCIHHLVCGQKEKGYGNYDILSAVFL